MHIVRKLMDNRYAKRTSGSRMSHSKSFSSPSVSSPPSNAPITLAWLARFPLTSALRPASDGRAPSKEPCHVGNNCNTRHQNQAKRGRHTTHTAAINSSCPLLVTVTPRARRPLPKTLLRALGLPSGAPATSPRRTPCATSSPLTSTKAWLRVLPFLSRRTCTRSRGCWSQRWIWGGVISCVLIE